MKIFVGSTGIGRIRGGLESSFVEIFAALIDHSEVKAWLFKGIGECSENEFNLWNLSRLSSISSLIGKVINRPNPYVVEQLSSILPMISAINRYKPDVVFYSEVNLGMALYRLRPFLNGDFKLIYCNGGPGDPPFPFTDHVHQVAPHYVDLALKAGVPEKNQTMIPYGLSFKKIGFKDHKIRQGILRKQLELPLERPIVLSVGWISRTHKRIDYIIRELASIGPDRPFLVMLGRTDSSSQEIINLAQELLRPSDYIIKSVSYEHIFDYYLASDLLVHAALIEGFGKVFTEALMHGLPCIAHNHPVMRYVLGQFGDLQNLEVAGSLADAIQNHLRVDFDPEIAAQRSQYVCENFSWDVLSPRYIDMFKHVMHSLT